MKIMASFLLIVFLSFISPHAYSHGGAVMGSLNVGTINISNNDDNFLALDSCIRSDIGFCVGFDAQNYETDSAYNINIGLHRFYGADSNWSRSSSWVIYKLKAGYGNEGFLLMPSIEFTPFPSKAWSRFTIYFGYQSYHENHGSLSGARFGLGYTL